MANRNRKRNRNRPSHTPGQPKDSGPLAARRLIDVPPPITLTDFSQFRICPGDPSPPPPPPGTGENGQAETRRESRANGVKRGLRSKLLFPIEMKSHIDELYHEFAIQLKPRTGLERWLVFEMARSSVQSDEANDQLLINKVRVIERVGTSWDDDNEERIDKLGSRLAADPYNVQRALARCKHGALYLVGKWTLMAEAVESNGGLDNLQIQTCYDLLGIEHVYRNGSRQVPEATDLESLRGLFAREIGRHRGNLERTLNARSDSEKEMAQLGIVKRRDTETRAIRSDLNRARRRFSWAMETLQRLQNGADASTIIDPDTGKPVAAGPPASAVPEPRPAAAPPAPALSATVTVTAPPPPATAPSLPPLPEGCSDEDKDMWLVAAGAVLSKSATPRCEEETGRPPTA
jgi:hypothetical protein